MCQINVSKNRLLFLLAIFFVLFVGNGCKESEILETHAKISVPADQFNIPVVDSMEAAYTIQYDFEAKFHDQIRENEIQSFLKVTNYVTRDSLHYSNSTREIRFPTFAYNSYFRTHFDGDTTRYFEPKLNNVIGLRKYKFDEKAFAIYIAWINRPIYFDSNNTLTPYPDTYYYTDNIDSTTFEVFTTIDTNIFRKMYKEYTGKITRIKIDTIFLPRYYTNTLYFYSKIRLSGFDNGEPIFAPPYRF